MPESVSDIKKMDLHLADEGGLVHSNKNGTNMVVHTTSTTNAIGVCSQDLKGPRQRMFQSTKKKFQRRLQLNPFKQVLMIQQSIHPKSTLLLQEFHQTRRQ